MNFENCFFSKKPENNIAVNRFFNIDNYAIPEVLEFNFKQKDIAIQRLRANTLEIPMADLRDYEQRQLDDKQSDLTDPLTVLEAKITHLAELLGCTEEHAERVLFKRIGSKT